MKEYKEYYAGKASGKTRNQKLMLKLVGELGWGQEVYDAYAKSRGENGDKEPHKTAIHEQMKRLLNAGFVKRVKKVKTTKFTKIVATKATKELLKIDELAKWRSLPESSWTKEVGAAYQKACLDGQQAYEDSLKKVLVILKHKVWFYTVTKSGKAASL